MTELLSALRQPPVVGRYYSVPVIQFPYCGWEDEWPVFGPLHHDRGGPINFEPLHYHVDPRFITGKQARRLRNYAGSVEACVARSPLAYRGREVPRRPHLSVRRCRVSSWQYSPLVLGEPQRPQWLDELEKTFGTPADAINLADGRRLCPHRRADLSSLPVDAKGTVVCPLHGLRVRCAVPA